ncbi:universal stress protein [Rasiella rasia]|uniref:Universal stress protein n=1 Tax=Rasiella rasia TaxID=2744027 RepID=A0A6G6GNA2_9FLAO|nr:universal stress protein [Rasiella rasia]QIE60032.1 universal stress protein [Rasiella rasia]
MKNQNKQNILVLTDLKENSLNVLKSAASLAHMTDADIELFHVKKPLEVVKHENQLSATRSIEEIHANVVGQLKQLAHEIYRTHAIKVRYSFSFGNIRNEVKHKLEQQQHDIVVVGKRTTKKPAYLGDNMVPFVLKNFDRMVLVADTKNVIEASESLAVGLLKDTTSDNPLAATLAAHAKKPLRLFTVASKNPAEVEAKPHSGEMVRYIFEQSDTVVKNISNYITKNAINLICVADRNKQPGDVNLNKIINQVGASLLVPAN